jgi:hypothetical protein
MALQTQTSEADLEKQRITDIGAMARQRLVTENNVNVANIQGEYGLKGETLKGKYGLKEEDLRSGRSLQGTQATAEAHKYTADQALKGREADAQAKIDAALARAKDPRSSVFEAWGKSLNPTPESLDVMMKGYERLFPKEPVSAPVVPGEADLFGSSSAAPTLPGQTSPPPARATLSGTTSPVPRPAEPITPTVALPARKKKPLVDLYGEMRANIENNAKERSRRKEGAQELFNKITKWKNSKFLPPGDYRID